MTGKTIQELRAVLLRANGLADRSRRIFRFGINGGIGGLTLLILSDIWGGLPMTLTGLTMIVLGAACLWYANRVIDRAIHLLRDHQKYL